MRAAFPDYAAIHSHVLQDVLARLDRAYQAFFRRIARRKERERWAFPASRAQGNRYHSFTFKEYGNGARLDNGFLVLSKIGRIAVHWSSSDRGHSQDRHDLQEADGWYVVLVRRGAHAAARLPLAQETGIDLGLESFASLRTGEHREPSRYYRVDETATCEGANGGCPSARRGANGGRKAVACAGEGASDGEAAAAGLSTIRPPSIWCGTTT